VKLPDPGKGKPATEAKAARAKEWAAPKTKAAKDKQRADRKTAWEATL